MTVYVLTHTTSVHTTFRLCTVARTESRVASDNSEIYTAA